MQPHERDLSVPQIGEDMNIRGKRLHLTHDCIHHSGAR